MRAHVFPIAIGFALAVLMLVAIGMAFSVARAHGDHDWMRQGQYRSPATGVHCCSPHQDCNIVPPSDVKMTPAGFVFVPTGETIPYENAIKSEDENFWRCETATKETRCFFFVPPGW